MDEALKWRSEGVPLRLDPEAESTDPSLPAFLGRPKGAPVYHGFPLLEESRTADGWCFGIISDPECRAGLIWEVGAAVLEVSLPPKETRWGVYTLGFAHSVHNGHELVQQLQGWLPELRRLHREWRASQRANLVPDA